MPILEKMFTPEKYRALYSVDEKFDGKRLDTFIKEYLPTFSREAIKQKIKHSDIIIEGRRPPHRPSSKVYFKEKIEIQILKTNHEDEFWRNKPVTLDLKPQSIFENDSLVVVGKPPFMSTHPTGKHLFNCVTVHFQSQLKKKTFSVHRLDRETSGLLLQGKSPESARTLTEYFEKNLVKKAYFFISKIDQKKGHRDLNFLANERLGGTKVGLERVYIESFPFESQEGKHAETIFKIIHKEKNYALGLAFPKTGRQHQIRVHAMIHHYPLLGDKLYLGSFKMFQRFKDGLATESDHDLMDLPRHALHAIGLKIPNLEEEHYFYSPIPDDLKNWIEHNLELPITKLENKIKENLKRYFDNCFK
jgi:RluA family pseudouridine synthase